ncbi:uncharacterized protein F5891DRAFT_978407 [Suillus fuscotomentosus]|uniref:Uncharacterized protein n=1 Tax=Suillus fuscotomentosus TaxID=1912939 RepID=A0AAD4EB95_9AGAM|nr:uncharacterized protein F5891DRAFT_978407 [Suillus fuscotomentosus]KAG1902962.1 hypothetical protein F5891DRAFT_978407 [Suillus fuscotomentosus]
MTDSAYFPRTYGKYRRPSSRRLAPPLGGPRALFGRMLAPFRRSHSNTNKSTELHQRLRRPIFSRGSHVVEVAAVKDREVIFTAPPPPEKTQQQTQTHAQGSSTTQPVPGANPTTPRPGYAHSLPVRLLAHLMLFLCCASQHANGNAQSTQQQQGQSQGHAQAEISSSQNRPPAAPTSMIPPAPATSPTAPSAASA